MSIINLIFEAVQTMLLGFIAGALYALCGLIRALLTGRQF